MVRRFRGEGLNKVDNKGRVSIPALFRRVIEVCDPAWTDGLNPELVIVYGDNRKNFLECYTIDAIDEVDEKINDLPRGSIQRKMLERLFHGQSFPTSVDDTGRLVIPQRLREKIGIMFGNPETTTGGNALKFYASIRLDIRRSTQIKDTNGNVLGNKTRVKVVKNKVAPPFKVSEFDIMYGKGISKMGEIIDLGVAHEIIDKSGSWFSYGETKLGQGRDSVKSILKDNPELSDEIEAKIVEAIKA